MESVANELEMERAVRLEAEAVLASNKERLHHLEESQRILAQQLERVQADKNAVTKSVLEWREGYHEANGRMRVAQDIATDALGAAAEHESCANAFQALQNMPMMQSAKLAITNRVIAIKDSSPSHSKLLGMAGLELQPYSTSATQKSQSTTTASFTSSKRRSKLA